MQQPNQCSLHANWIFSYTHAMTFLGNNDGLCDLVVKLPLTFFSCMQPPSNAVCGQFSRLQSIRNYI